MFDTKNLNIYNSHNLLIVTISVFYKGIVFILPLFDPNQIINPKNRGSIVQPAYRQ